MVGIMALSPREKVASLVNSAKMAMDVPSKLEHLRQLNEDWFQDDPVLISEFLPNLFDLQTDRFSPVRKFVTQMIGEIGLRHMESIPEIVPVLTSVIQDNTPAVARQAITCGIDLFRRTLEKVALQGLYTSELDESLEASWAWMIKFKDNIHSIAFQPGSDSIRLLALKFVEAVILLYTLDPNGSSEPPPHQAFEGSSVEFNISWLRGGHPLLKVGDLSIEASQSLSLLLDQLRFPTVKSLSRSMTIVLINSLAAIAKKRPAFYGRILPVLLGLNASNTTINAVHKSATHYALKKAFLSCLNCTHPGAAPWRERLVGALRELEAGGMVERALHQVSTINGSLGEENIDPLIKEEKPSIRECDALPTNVGKKRPGVQNISDLDEDDDSSMKRIRQSPVASEGSSKESKKELTMVQDDTSLEVTSSKGDGDTGPVQQLVAMFGALVAQGEKAVGSLEILISSISADLLAEVVMANMRHLPPNRPKAEGEEGKQQDMGIIGSDKQVKHPSVLLADLFSLSSAFPQIASLFNVEQSEANDVMETQEDKVCHVPVVAESEVLCPPMNHETEEAPLHGDFQVSPEVQSVMEMGSPAVASVIRNMENLENGIPGLESVACSDGLPQTMIASSLVAPDLEDGSQEHVASLVGRSPINLPPSMSTERSEELSPKSAVTDANSIISSTETSYGLSHQVILPKMSAPVISLTDEEKDNLQKVAFTRIVEAYKQIAVSGGSQVRFSLIAYLGVEFPLELDPWKVLQNHILSDYINHEGHELTLRVLYRLFGEAEEEHDFFSSTNAKSVYEMFLLTVAETLRDSFSATDKSLSRLLGEVPYLPKSVFTLLECLCCPGSGLKDEKDIQSGDRVTQGLSAVWSLILLRPPIRDACLSIALQSAVHQLEEVRMKAIRLVANKLYPISSISQRIEDFAKEMLLSVIDGAQTAGRTEVDGTSLEPRKDLNLDTPERPSVSGITRESSDIPNLSISESISSSSLSEAQRCMSLYFALCTKKHSLFRQIFVIYKSTSKSAKQAVHRHIPILVRTIGSSTQLLEIISDPPSGSENLLMQVLQTLTDGTIPSPELISTIRKLYDSKLKNAEILIPILPFLPRDEVLLIFPSLVNLPLDKFQAALARALQGSSPPGLVLTPAEVLIAIHGIDPDRDGIPLKKVTDACNACFEQRQIFTQQVLAKVLNQLVEQIPLPLLFMRTVLQAIGAFPGLVDFIMEILSRLVSKHIWKYPKLWVGFLKCAQLTSPQSFSVLLQLPPAQLENALNRIAALKEPLVAHANQPNIRSSLPRSILVVLGIASDSQASSQAQTSQVQTGDTSNSDKDVAIEKTRESSSVS